jgi:antitoxin component YwqK of YwqJK toxin-antitoxin module
LKTARNNKKYLSNGTLIGEWICKIVHLEGVSHVFHENGSLKIESNFTNGSVRDTVDNIIMMEH